MNSLSGFSNDDDCIREACLLHEGRVSCLPMMDEILHIRFDQTLSTTVFLFSLSANSGRLSRSAMRVPQSGLVKSFTREATMIAPYSSGATFFPIWRTRETTVAAEAQPNSSVETMHGRMRHETNSGGKEEAESFNVLHNYVAE